jgi:hypothetical protein
MILLPTKQGAFMELITVETKRCMHCGETGQLQVTNKGWEMRLAGAYVQDSFPELTAPLREQLISGTHPECWDEMFGLVEVEDYDYSDCE